MQPVVLFNPRKRDPRSMRWIGEHLGLAYLAASLRAAGFGAEIIDADLSDIDPETAALQIAAADPLFVGVSLYEESVPYAREYCDVIAAATAAPIILGGHFASLEPRAACASIETAAGVLAFECETNIIELTRRLGAGEDIYAAPGMYDRDGRGIQQSVPVDLERIPWPSRDLLPEVLRRGGAAFLCSSRGCFSTCHFCSIATFYRQSHEKPWRARSASGIADELQFLIEGYGITTANFVDDSFIGNVREGRQRALQFAHEVIQRQLSIEFTFSCRAQDVDEELFSELRAAGLRRTFIGFEAFEDEQLARFGKGCRSKTNIRAIEILRGLEIDVIPSVIMFSPFQTIDGLERTTEILSAHFRTYDPTILWSELWLLSGTRVARELRRADVATVFAADHVEFADPLVRDLYDETRVLADAIRHANRMAYRSKLALGVDQHAGTGSAAASLNWLRQISEATFGELIAIARAESDPGARRRKLRDRVMASVSAMQLSEVAC